MLVAVNEGVSLLWKALAANFSSITRRVKGYTLTGNDLLPDDFDTLVELVCMDNVFTALDPIAGKRYGYQGAPHIEGQWIFGKGNVKMTYNYLPREVSRMDDFLDIPFQVISDIVSIASNLVTANIDGAYQRAGEAGRRLSQNREFAGIPDMVAFP